MKTSTRLKITCSIAIFFTTIMVLAQDSIMGFEALPSNSEKLKLVLPKAYWFNSYKLKIANYGVAKIKENAPDTDAIKKQKISINLTDFNNNTSTLSVRTVQEYFYSTRSHNLENNILSALGTGIEVDPQEHFIDSIAPKTIKGTIITSLKNSKNWDICFVKDNEPSLFTKMGSLTDGERTINVILTNLYSNKNINENGDIYAGVVFYEFIENGISLGAVASRGEHTIWLRPGLDPSTKLILCSAMLLAGGYYIKID